MVAVGAILQGVSGVFNSISKTKKASWKAMKGAMGAVKGASGPMAAIGKALKVFAPILKIVNALFKYLGAVILTMVMPALVPLLEYLSSPLMLSLMHDIAEIIAIALIPGFELMTEILKVVIPVLKQATQFILENKWALDLLILVLFPLLGVIRLLTQSWDNISKTLQKVWGVLVNVGNYIKNVLINVWNSLTNGLKMVANGFIWFINTLIDGINVLMNAISLGYWNDIGKIPYLQRGTNYVPYSGLYHLHKGEEVIPAHKTSSSNGIVINIDLRNAVVDNVDNLSRRIAENVLMQIG